MHEARKMFFVAGGSVLLLASLAAGAATQAPATRENGHAVFEKWCTPCHGRGPGHPGTQALEVKYKGEMPALLEERTDLTPETVEYFVRHGVNVMPPFRRVEISDGDLAALSAYLAPRQETKARRAK